MPARTQPKVYTARSQFWVGNTFFKPIDRGGKAIDADDPMLTTHRDMFEEYNPRTRDYGQPSVVNANTRIARIEAPDEEPASAPVPHTHPHPEA